MAEIVTPYLVEDIGAIAFEFGTHEQIGDLYNALGDYLGGFTALWGFYASAGQVFHEEVSKHPAGVWDRYSWPESVDKTVDNIVKAAIANPASVPADNFSDEQRKWLQKHIEII